MTTGQVVVNRKGVYCGRKAGLLILGGALTYSCLGGYGSERKDARCSKRERYVL
jgi:hypothetical protein